MNVGERELTQAQIVAFFGRAFSILGALFAVPAVLFGLYEGSIQHILPVGFMALMLGVMGWCCGSNKLGVAVMTLSLAAMFFGLSISQGHVAGVDATDPANPSVSRQIVADSNQQDHRGEYAGLGATSSNKR